MQVPSPRSLLVMQLLGQIDELGRKPLVIGNLGAF
jgi:hypothetical protein